MGCGVDLQEVTNFSEEIITSALKMEVTCSSRTLVTA
jgi:hypothetical protein